MKKGLLFLLVLSLLLGAVFFLGWIQLNLPAGHYAVGFSKFSGFDEQVFNPGEFMWRAAKVIPGTYQLFRFPLSTRTVTVRIQGELLSGSVYATFLENTPDFHFDLPFRLSYQIKPEALPGLVSDNHLRPESLDDYYATIESLISSEIHESITHQLGNPETMRSLNYNAQALGSLLKRNAESNHPEIQIDSLTPGNLIFPDLQLYEQGRKIYFSVMEEKERTLRLSMQRTSEESVTEENRLKILREYGEILSTYPLLLDYFSLRQEDMSRLIPDLPISVSTPDQP